MNTVTVGVREEKQHTALHHHRLRRQHAIVASAATFKF
jgi:hypothetical protein